MRIPSIDVRVDGPLTLLYPDREPFHFTYEGRSSALSGVSAFLNERGPHWHYIGYGLRPRFPFELTFRLSLGHDDSREVAPAWPRRLLLAFAEHALNTAKGFEPGHYLCFPDAWDPAQAMRCGLLVQDTELRARSTDPWLQIVGLHDAELDWVSGDRWQDFVRALGESDPLLVTSPSRPPIRRSDRSS